MLDTIRCGDLDDRWKEEGLVCKGNCQSPHSSKEKLKTGQIVPRRELFFREQAGPGAGILAKPGVPGSGWLGGEGKS